MKNKFIHFNWRIKVQHSDGVYRTATWVGHGVTRPPSWAPSRLPPHPSLWVIPSAGSGRPASRTEPTLDACLTYGGVVFVSVLLPQCHAAFFAFLQVTSLSLDLR